MELGDIWVKVANRLRLTPEEQEFLRLEGRNTQQRNTLISGWTGADGKATLISPTITSPTWTDSPLAPYKIQKGTAQDLPSGGTYTRVEFGNLVYGIQQFSKYFVIDEGDATKISLKRDDMAILITGAIAVGASGAGDYIIAYFLSNGDSDELNTSTLLLSGGTTLNFSSIIYTRGSSYIQIGAYQNSGSTIPFSVSGTYMYMCVI